MRRTVLMLVVAAMAAAVMPLAFPAGPARPRAESARRRLAAPSILGGAPCSLIEVPLPTAVPVGAGTCPGVRPGAGVSAKGPVHLQLPVHGPDGRALHRTAGHCVLAGPVADNAGESVWEKGTGPGGQDSEERIGEFAYAVLAAPKDLALIRLDPGVEASPQMCHFGGPTGSTTAPPTSRRCSSTSGMASASATCSRPLRPGRGLPQRRPRPGRRPGPSGRFWQRRDHRDGRAVGVLVTMGPHGLGFDENGVSTSGRSESPGCTSRSPGCPRRWASSSPW